VSIAQRHAPPRPRKCPLKIIFLVGGSFELRSSFPVLEEEGFEVQGTAQVKSLTDLVERIAGRLKELPPHEKAVGVVVAEPLNGCFSGISARSLVQQLKNKLKGKTEERIAIIAVGDSATPKTALRKLLQGA